MPTIRLPVSACHLPLWSHGNSRGVRTPVISFRCESVTAVRLQRMTAYRSDHLGGISSCFNCPAVYVKCTVYYKLVKLNFRPTF